MACQPAFELLEGPVLVSACLLGIPCRYDGTSKPCPDVINLRNIIPVPVCPEQLGGLPTPRPAARFTGGDGRDVLHQRAALIQTDGTDVTERFTAGARHVLSIARILGIDRAVLKDGSPSCATCSVTLDERKVPGVGVTAALLLESGIRVMNEHGKVSKAVPPEGCAEP